MKTMNIDLELKQIDKMTSFISFLRKYYPKLYTYLDELCYFNNTKIIGNYIPNPYKNGNSYNSIARYIYENRDLHDLWIL